MRLTVLRVPDAKVMASATILTISHADYLDKPLKNNGEPCWVRTSDLLIKSQLLYRLS
jgi:hypothetical protein